MSAVLMVPLDANARAARVGAQHATLGMVACILTAAAIVVWAFDVQGLWELVSAAWPATVITLICGPGMAWFIGRWMGRRVLVLGGNSFVYSVITAVACVAITSVAMAVAGWSIDAANGHTGMGELVKDYIGRTLFWILWIGGIPILIASAIMAVSLRRVRRLHFK